MPSSKKLKSLVKKLLKQADVEIDGTRPWDIRVINDALYDRMIQSKNLGLGEAYMDGWWECDTIDKLVHRLLGARVDRSVSGNIAYIMPYISARLFNRQTKTRSREVADRHYDLDNDLFFTFLDTHYQYSCAYFNGTDDLNQAQERKLELICRKLDLQEGDRVLDIGCGWGGLARYMAEHYGVSVTAINISKNQIDYAREYCRGYPVEVRYQDYRDIGEQYDKVVSVGMFEHVGYKNYPVFMKTVERILADDGLFLLHTIGGNISGINTDVWIEKYIFPNGMLPSIAQISSAVEGLFVIEDWHNMGPHYDRTLMAWNRNFQENWHRLNGRYDFTFKRMWEYYLLSCAGAFRARHIQLWQILFSKCGRVQPLCRF